MENEFDMNEIENGLKDAFRPVNERSTADKEQTADQNKDVKSDDKSDDAKPEAQQDRFKSRLALENEKREAEAKKREADRLEKRRQEALDKLIADEETPKEEKADDSYYEDEDTTKPKKTFEEIAEEVYERKSKESSNKLESDKIISGEIDDLLQLEPKLEKYKEVIKDKMVSHNLSAEAASAMLKGMGIIPNTSSKTMDIGTRSKNSLHDNDEVDFNSMSDDEQDAFMAKATGNGKDILFS